MQTYRTFPIFKGMICIYCFQEVSDDKFNAEHVFPQALASIENNPFILRSVCARCNEACGRHVDAPYLKSFAVQSGLAQVHLRYTEITKKTVLPLQFLGEVANFRHESKICELWSGPGGDTFYHFHEPYDQSEHARVAVGIPRWGPKRNFDAGFVMVAIRTGKEPWLSVAINSGFAAFPDSQFYLLNGPTPLGKTSKGRHFSDMPELLTSLADQIRSRAGQNLNCRLTVYTDAPDRFMCKLALGYGALFFHPDFLGSPDAQRLRKALWTRSADDREKIKIRGRKFLGADDAFRSLPETQGCQIFAGVAVDRHFVLMLRLVGGESHSIVVSSEPRYWRGTAVQEGGIFVIAPTLRKFVGPLSLHEYVVDAASQKEGTDRPPPHPELAALRHQLSNIPALPPFD